MVNTDASVWTQHFTIVINHFYLLYMQLLVQWFLTQESGPPKGLLVYLRGYEMIMGLEIKKKNNSVWILLYLSVYVEFRLIQKIIQISSEKFRGETTFNHLKCDKEPQLDTAFIWEVTWLKGWKHWLNHNVF